MLALFELVTTPLLQLLITIGRLYFVFFQPSLSCLLVDLSFSLLMIIETCILHLNFPQI